MGRNASDQTGPRGGMDRIAKLLEEMKFRKKVFGGVDESDVWRQLERLQQEYQTVYDRQAAYYEALLEEREEALARLTQSKGGAASG